MMAITVGGLYPPGTLPPTPLIVFHDYGSGLSVGLPAYAIGAFVVGYFTNKPGSASFGVQLYNATAAAFTLTTDTLPNPVPSLLPTNNASLCTPNASLAVALSTTTVVQCNYTVSWTTPFTSMVFVTLLQSDIFINGYGIFFQINPAVSVTGDPHFVGLRGQQFQVHGLAGVVYNLISGRWLQVNARFVFLAEGECPFIGGVKVEAQCWSHTGSYMGEMSFQAVVDGERHAALVVAGGARSGCALVQVDGRALSVGDRASFGSLSVSRPSSHEVRVHTEQFDLDLTNSDRFLNLAVHVNVPLSELTTHGLLGQTHSTDTHHSRHIEGEVDDYTIADNDIFGSGFMYNQFAS